MGMGILPYPLPLTVADCFIGKKVEAGEATLGKGTKSDLGLNV